MDNITGLICLSINSLSDNLHGKPINKNKINIPNNMQTNNCKKKVTTVGISFLDKLGYF